MASRNGHVYEIGQSGMDPSYAFLSAARSVLARLRGGMELDRRLDGSRCALRQSFWAHRVLSSLLSLTEHLRQAARFSSLEHYLEALLVSEVLFGGPPTIDTITGASDQPNDIHSPSQQGFWWSHMLWFMTRENYQTDEKMVKDWIKYPELRFLDRFDFLAPALLALLMFAFGAVVPHTAVAQFWNKRMADADLGFLDLNNPSLYHVTFAINSLAHVYGSRRFDTDDDSRNNIWLALITFGEGWHNNHHFFPNSARQGFYWWEIDISYLHAGLHVLVRAGLGPEAGSTQAYSKRPHPNSPAEGP